MFNASNSIGVSRTVSKRAAMLSIGTALLMAAQLATAQGYPTRAVELVVPFAAGGGSDTSMRIWADAAARLKFPQPVLIVNKAGAGGAIGLAEGANGRPDGHKLTMVSTEINLTQLQGMGKTKGDDFIFIARVNADPLLLVVRTDSRFKTLEDLIAAAKAKPGELNLANSGAGGMFHLGAAAFEEKSGLKFNNIPYIGSGPEIIALAAGQVDVAVLSTAEAGTWVRDGKFRVLAVWANKRFKDYPQVPTLKERGIDLEMDTWRSIAVPKATPPQVVTTLRELAQKIHEDKQYQTVLAGSNISNIYDDGDKVTQLVASEYKFYGDLLGKLGLRK
jgi:tripartite-type tricarboxylate transporter receptor subunit TctC